MTDTEKIRDDTKKPVLDEIASIKKDIFYDYMGNVVLNPDKVLRSESGGKGIEIYEDLLRDHEIRSAMQTRRLAVVGKEWEVIPASDKRQDIRIADYVKEVLLGFNYDVARKALLSGIVTGFKPAEIMWEYSEGDVWIKDIVGKSARRFVFDLQGNLRLLTPQNMIEGEQVPARKFIVFKNVSDNGSYYGDGLGSSLYWLVWFKKNGIKFWAIFCDKFGSPTAVGRYPSGTTKEQQDALLEALEAIQQESAIKIPDTMIIEFLEAARAGSINTYESFCAYMDKGINKLILGHGAASDSTPGKLGNENQAGEIRQDYIKADADALCECQNNSVIQWLVDYNFPGVREYPKVWVRTEAEKDLMPLAERDRILTREIGLPVSKKYFYETYGIPQPGEDEELVETQGLASVLPASQPPLSPFAKGDFEARGFAENRKSHCPHCFAENNSPLPKGARGLSFPDQQALDAAIDSLPPDDLQAQMEGVLKPIIELLQEGNDYNVILEKLSEAYPNIDDKAIEEMLTRAIFVSELWGRLNATRD